MKEIKKYSKLEREIKKQKIISRYAGEIAQTTCDTPCDTPCSTPCDTPCDTPCSW